MDKLNNMKTYQKIGLVALVASFLLLIGNAAFAADSAVWTTVSVSGKLSDSVTLNVEEEWRFADVADPSLARQHTDLSVACEVGNYLTAVSGYRNTSTGEHRPYVGVNFSLLSGDLSVGSASRLELRDFDTLRGRTELSVTTTVVGVAPYISDEVFIDDSGVTGNRASVGVSKSIDDTFGVNAYYMLDSAMGDSTSHTHVVGVGLSVSL